MVFVRCAQTMNTKITNLTLKLSQALIGRGWKLSTAESCTGGGLAYSITGVGGSSAWFEQGFVTYSNKAKTQQLDVDSKLLESFGEVSGQAVLAMAQGALNRAGADISVAISGIAGPSGGSKDKPVGTVWVAWATADNHYNQLFNFTGDRKTVREEAIAAALDGLIALVARR